MDEQNVNRRQMLGGAAAVGAAAVLGSDARAAQPAKSAVAAEPVIPDLGDAQAPPIKDVKDKVAYITGGSSGIGLGIARALHERGAKVILGNLDDRQFADALKMFPPNDARVATVIHNVMERDGWETKADEIEKKFGPVSILANNAGVGVQSGGAQWHLQRLGLADGSEPVGTRLRSENLCSEDESSPGRRLPHRSPPPRPAACW